LTSALFCSIVEHDRMSELPFESPDGFPLEPPRGGAAVESVLSGEIVVFTGKLWSLGRKEARSTVERLGGSVDDEVTLRTTLVVVGSQTYPDGVPDLDALAADHGTHRQKLRRAAQLNAEQPGRIRIISEDEFCRRIGLPSVADLRGRHYGQRDILAMYPALREDHLRYLQKWGFIRPAFKNNADTFFAFSDLTVLRQVHRPSQNPVQGVERSVLIPPVHVGPRCVIENAIVGPHVSLAEGVTIRDAIVRDTILADGAHVEGAVLEGSIVGPEATVRGRARTVNLGDNSEVTW
jgi:hypothetical protein